MSDRIILDHGFYQHPFDPYPWRCYRCGNSVRLHRSWPIRMILKWRSK